MPLVPAKCTNCGAPLTLDDSSVGSTIECPYCHTSLVFERTPDNTFVTNYKIAHADTVIVQDSNSLENRLANAQTYLDVHRDYEAARELFESLAHDVSGEWKAWWGLLRARTSNFTDPHTARGEFEEDERVARSAFAVAPEEVQDGLSRTWEAFAATHESGCADLRHRLDESARARSENAALLARLKEELRDRTAELERLESRQSALSKSADKSMATARASYKNGCLWGFLGLLAISLIAGMSVGGELFLLLAIIAAAVAGWYFLFKDRSDKTRSEAVTLAGEVERAKRGVEETRGRISQCERAETSLSGSIRDLNSKL